MKAAGKRKYKAPIKFTIDLQAFESRPVYKFKRSIKMSTDTIMGVEPLSEDRKEEEKTPPRIQSPFKKRAQN